MARILRIAEGKATAILLPVWLMLFAATTASAGNIVVNGDFENGFYAFGAGTTSTVPNGWILGPPGNIAQSSLHVDNTVDPALSLNPESGADYVRFNSPATDGTRDCLLQDMVTVPGQTYIVSFWVAITSTSVGNFLGLSPIWDENTPNQSTMGPAAFYFAPANTAPVSYQEFTFLEIASSNLTRIDFHGVDSNGSILLDNVSVVAAPEPSMGWLTALGLVIGGRRLARRRL